MENLTFTDLLLRLFCPYCAILSVEGLFSGIRAELKQIKAGFKANVAFVVPQISL